MSETISQLPTGSAGTLTDVVPVTQGSTAPGTGITRKLTSAQILSSNGFVYAGDPQFGVLANGSTDDTSSWTAALTYARAVGAWVVAPPGVSIVSSITVPANVGIVGRNVECLSVSSSQGSPTLGSVISSNSSTLPTVVMSPNSQLQDIQIDGNPGQDAIRFVTTSVGSIQITNVDIFGAGNGINGNSASAFSIISGCRIHECVNGIANVVDASINNNIITNNSASGISLGAGCARVLINGNRISANGTNISLVGTSSTFVSNICISGNVVHDSNANNVLMSFCHNVAVTGNEIGCAGRAQGSSPGTFADANYQIGNCTGVVVCGNSSWVSNDLTGYIGPFYAIFDAGANVNCLFSSNILPYHNNAGSSTTGPINTTVTFNLASTLNITYWTATN